MPDNLTPEKRNWYAKFLASLRKSANVAASCKAAGISRTTAYDNRNADDAFKAAWDEALEDATDTLEKEAWRRAVSGTKKPVYQGGKLAGYVQEYSDTLLIFLLKAHRPEKYRERHEVMGEGGGPVVLRVVYDRDGS